MKKEVKSGTSKVWVEFVSSVVGVTKLAFIASNGIAAYVLLFSTDSTTLHGVAIVLSVETAIMALALSRSKQ